MKYGLLCCYGLLGQYLAEIQIFEIWNLILNLKFLVVHLLIKIYILIYLW